VDAQRSSVRGHENSIISSKTLLHRRQRASRCLHWVCRRRFFPPSLRAMLTVASRPLDAHASPPFLRLFALVFAMLAVAVTWLHRESFFAAPYHEEGDSAANALQIHRAKQWAELHGNYSRFQFHHPGPAFFYFYAAGERLLCDVLAIAPAPRNAHVYSGALLQLAFYAMAIALVARHARQPLLVAGLALAAGTLHLSHVDRAFFSIWPPDVLLMPFLCFVVACASVAMGDRRTLPVLVLAGGFLVHGHVAQALFVVPLAAIALLLAWRAGAWRRPFHRPSLIGALVLLALFLLPLALDLLRGHASNANAIWLHIRFNSEPGQTLWQAMLCYAAYFAGLTDPSIFNELNAAAYAPLRERGWLMAAWLGMLAGAVWLSCSPHRQDADSGPAPMAFVRRLLWFWLGASVLTVIWAMRQEGGLTSFNSHFNHTLVHVIAFAFILSAVQWLRPLPGRLALTVAAAAVVAFALGVPYTPADDRRGDEVAARLPALLRADPKPAAAKLITIPGDEWYEAVTLARALQRLGVKFYVDPEWRFLFGRDHVFAAQPDTIDLSEWRVVKQQGARPGAHVLNRECYVVFPDVARLAALPARIDFAAKGEPSFHGIGIRRDGEWAWTEGNAAALRFIAPTASRDIELVLEASGFVSARSPRGQRAVIRLNGELLAREHFGAERRSVRLVVPREAWNRQATKVLTLELPDAVSPAAAGMSGDRRLLGLRLFHLAISPVAQ
jgi:hypothetical protein